MRYYTFLLITLFLVACSHESEDSLRVISAQLPLREAAGLKGKELLVLKKGDLIRDLHAVSHFESVIEWQGNLLQSPWIQVESGQQTGWVLAALLLPQGTEHAAWLQNKRLICYFGPQLTQRRKAWLETIPSIQTDAQMASHYREAIALRDTMMLVLANRAESSETESQLDYRWLGAILPGFIPQNVPGRKGPYLFADFGYWQKAAKQTGGTQDDLFFEFYAQLFPYDKIESYFPVWKFQLDDHRSASQLGSGNHLKVLAGIETSLSQMNLFRPEMMRLKEQVLDDIAGNGISYWQNVEKVLAELNNITSSNFSILNNEDRMTIQTRLGMFENSAANGIRVNLRSGGVE